MNAKPGPENEMHAAPEDDSKVPVPAVRDPFVLRLGEVLRGPCGVGEGETILVAVSGGADSLALLAGLAALADRSHRRYGLHVASVHHHFRDEAEAEVQYVEEVTARLGLPFHRIDVHPGRSDGNISAKARSARYGALADLAREINADIIATAHHGTDQLETLLLALVRGAGLDGLAAMPWRTEVHGVPVIRPLLNQTHEDCLDLCRRIGWCWIEDPTNRDTNLARGRVRHEILDSLLSMRPGLDADIHRTTDLLRSAVALVDERVGTVIGESATDNFCRDDLARENPLVIGAVLRKSAIAQGAPADRLSHEVTMSAVEAVRDSDRHPRRFEWPGEIDILVTVREVRVERRTS